MRQIYMGGLFIYLLSSNKQTNKTTKGGLKRDHGNFMKNIQDLKYINLPKS